jgi:hypothetical protein
MRNKLWIAAVAASLLGGCAYESDDEDEKPAKEVIAEHRVEVDTNLAEKVNNILTNVNARLSSGEIESKEYDHLLEQRFMKVC